MESNPYAPPKAAVVDLRSTGLKQRSVIVMIVLTIATLGVYYPIWFFRRRRALNSLDSPRKVALWPPLLVCASQVVAFFTGVAAAGGVQLDPTIRGVLLVVRLIIGILMLWQCFVIKDILEDHLAGPDDPSAGGLFVDRVQLSGLLTFFFSIYYLQYVINREIVRFQQHAA